MTDVESIIEQIIDLLNVGLPDKLAAIAAEKHDGIPLEEVGKFYFGERFIDKVVSVTVPVITVSAEQLTARNVQAGYSEDDISAVITVILRGDKEEAITRKAMRYARAVREALELMSALDLYGGGSVKHSSVTSVDYSPLTRSGDVVFMGVDIRATIGVVTPGGN
jgi:hypothetical protein